METVVTQTPLWMNILLGIVALHLLIMPLTVRLVESHLELFLLAVGAVAVTVSNGWSGELVRKTLSAPVYVSFIVVVVSVIFNNYSRYIFRVLFAFFRALEPRYSFALLVFLLGMASSLVMYVVDFTAGMASSSLCSLRMLASLTLLFITISKPMFSLR